MEKKPAPGPDTVPVVSAVGTLSFPIDSHE